MPSIVDKINKGVEALANCDCGKELCIMDMYGMFCEDMCGHTESVVAREGMEKLIDDAVGIIEFFENLKMED